MWWSGHPLEQIGAARQWPWRSALRRPGRFVLLVASCFLIAAVSAQPTRVNLEHELPGEDGAQASLHIAAIHALDRETAFLLGSLDNTPYKSSVLLRTADGGRSWDEVMKRVDGSAVARMCFLENQAWALVQWEVEDPGEIDLYHSTDAGRSWSRVAEIPRENRTGRPTQMRFRSALEGAVTLEYLDLESWEPSAIVTLATVDGGKTWSEAQRHAPSPIAPDKDAEYRPGPPPDTAPDGTRWEAEVWSRGFSSGVHVMRSRPGDAVAQRVASFSLEYEFIDGRVIPRSIPPDATLR